MRRAVLGVFVAGASRRMRGHPKGLLPAPDTGEPIVAKLVRLGREVDLEAVLVGRSPHYAAVAPGVPTLEDRPAGVGPLGGLAALLAHADGGVAVAVACDMPFVTAASLRRVATSPSTAQVVAPRRGPEAPFEPFLARYDAARALPVVERALRDGARSFQRLFALCEVDPLELDAELASALTDWDSPDDLLAVSPSTP